MIKMLHIVCKAQEHTWLTQWASSMTKRARRPRSYRFCKAEISLLLALTLGRRREASDMSKTSVPSNIFRSTRGRRKFQRLKQAMHFSPFQVWHRAVWQSALSWRAAYRSSLLRCHVSLQTGLLLGSEMYRTNYVKRYRTMREAEVNILTSNVVSFWIWSTISDLRGEMTTVTPGDKQAGSW